MLNKHYDNLFEIELDTKVIDCKESDGKYYHAFEDTLFYVKSGGMESDYGWINGNTVSDVIVDNDIVWHCLDVKLEGNVHMKIDLEYRLFKSQIHTAQHLMCTIMNTDYHAKTIMFKTGEHESEIEMGFDTLNRDILNDIETKCNDYILQDIPVVIGYPTKEEALANIWEDYGENFDWNIKLRSVSIPGVDYDLCACIHVPTLRYLHAIKFLNFEKTTRGYKIAFVAGQQLIQYMQEHFDIYSEASKLLAVSQLEITDSIHKLLHEKKEMLSTINDYKQKYFDLFVKDLCMTTKDTYLFNEFEGMDVKTFQQLCATLTNNYEKGFIFILKIDDKCHLVVSKHKSLPIKSNEIFKDISTHFELRGGGNPIISQGGGIYSDALCNYVQTCIQKMNEAK